MTDEKITTMDKAAAKRLADAMREALAPVAERFGVEISVGGGTVYEEGTYKPKIELRTGNAEENTFRSLAPQLWPPLEPDDYGKTFTVQGRSFTIAGINQKAHPKARKTPVICSEGDKRFRFDSQQILRALGRSYSVSGGGLAAG
jgi:hypothetical protein